MGASSEGADGRGRIKHITVYSNTPGSSAMTHTPRKPLPPERMEALEIAQKYVLAPERIENVSADE